MPNLREGEYMHVCESPFCYQTTGGSRAGKPRPYVVHKYHKGIERKWCQTCLDIAAGSGTHKIISVYDERGNWNGYRRLGDEDD